MGTSVNEIPVWDRTEKRILHSCYIWNTCVPRTVPHPPTPPGKAWASSVVAACCGDGGLSHPIPPPEVVHFHPEGDLRNQRCTADLQRWCSGRLSGWERADSACCCGTLTLSDSRTIKKYFWPAVSIYYQQERALPVTHQNFGILPYQIFASFFLRVISPCRKKPQTIRK